MSRKIMLTSKLFGGNFAIVGFRYPVLLFHLASLYCNVRLNMIDLLENNCLAFCSRRSFGEEEIEIFLYLYGQ